MAHINELMGAGVPARLARMLGSNRLQTVYAAGANALDSTQLAINFALLASTGPGQGVMLECASGAALTALYNTGPDPVLIYPMTGDAFNEQMPDAPLPLPAGSTFVGVSAVDAWLVVIAGNAAPLPDTPPSFWVVSGGTTTLLPGIGRAFVDAGAAVTVVLPLNDCQVMDRGPQASSFAITVAAPAGTTINGNPNVVLSSDWASARFVYDGSNFGIG